MLHVFHLDAGHTILLDVHYVTETIAKLKEAINGMLSAPASDQILLISGGEVLDSARKVASYGAGHDSSNPIFLICKCDFGQAGPSSNKYMEPFMDQQTSRDNEAALIRQKHATAASSISYQAIQHNAQLAKKFIMTTEEYATFCRRLVDEQHLMHQGWRAVTANLEDTWRAFSRRAARFHERRDKLGEQNHKIRQLLDNFGADLSLLKRIPLLSCLFDHPASEASCDLHAKNRRRSWSDVSLYDWIASKEPDSSLQALATEVKHTLEEIFDAKASDCLSELEKLANERVGDSKMKEIKGLGQRLDQLNRGLEILTARQMEQKELAEKIMRKEEETLNLRDVSRLSQVCSGQLDDLSALLENNQRLLDTTRRFHDAKNELLHNVRVRLRWLSDTHHLIQTADGKVLLCNERLRKVRRQLQLLKQVHESPLFYALAVAEVFRRRLFGAQFLDWAKGVVEKSQSLYEDENRLRQHFSRRMDRHFLRCLFPGMDDSFPAFCLEMPKLFDAGLAKIEMSHICEIKSTVPSLSPYLQVEKTEVLRRPTGDVVDRGVALSGAASFLTAAQRRASVSSLNSLGAACQSPNWTSGDECSPSPFSLLVHLAPSTPDDLDAAATVVASAGQSPPQVGSCTPCPGNMPRSAPIAIPVTRAPTLNTWHHFSSPSHSSFATPGGDNVRSSLYNASDPSFFPTDVLNESSFMRKKSLRNFSSSSLCNLTPLGEEPTTEGSACHSGTQDESKTGGKFVQVERRLEDASPREQNVQNEARVMRQKEREGDELLKTGPSLMLFLTECKSAISDVRRTLAEFGRETQHSTSLSSRVLLDAARKLEVNLQNNLAEARKASEALQKAEFQPVLDEMRDELEKEKQAHRECLKRLENCQAYLKQKDDVIELLQQRLDESERRHGEELLEASSQLTKRLTLEHELDLDKLRSEFHSQIDRKEAENRYLATELNEKNRVMKRMRKEQDKLTLSASERTNCDLHTPHEGLRPLDQELLSRLKSLKSDYDRELSQLSAGLSEKHSREVEDLKCEYELQLQLLRAKLDSADDVVDSPPSPQAPCHEDCVDEMSQSANGCTVIERASPEEKPFGPPENRPLAAGCGASGTEKEPCAAVAGPLPYSQSRFTQTKCTAQQQVSVLRVRKGDLILLVFDPETDAFTVFTVSPILYILKESSVQRMGLRKPVGTGAAADPLARSVGNLGTVTEPLVPRSRTATGPVVDPLQRPVASSCWTLARLVDMDFCQIKKEHNRYNLPMNTKFYRISAQKCDFTVAGDLKL